MRDLSFPSDPSQSAALEVELLTLRRGLVPAWTIREHDEGLARLDGLRRDVLTCPRLGIHGL